jgi:hypothetical protein
MTTKEIRKLIGKRITWDTRPAWSGHFTSHGGTVEKACGGNVMIDGNWQWLRDMRNIRVKAETE